MSRAPEELQGEQNIVRIADEVDAAAAALQRARHAAEERGQGRLYGAAAKANLRNFSAAMESATATPLRRDPDASADPRQMGGFSGAGKHPRDPQGVADVMDRLIAGRGWKSPVAAGSVMNQWPRLVGDVLAEATTPESFEDGVLRVRCRSTSYAANLRMMQRQILDSIERQLGERVVTRLEILGPVTPRWSKGRLTARGRGPRDTYG